MERGKILGVRVTPWEDAVIAELAQREKMPVGTLARRLLLLAAEAKGITPSSLRFTGERTVAGEVLPDTEA